MLQSLRVKTLNRTRNSMQRTENYDRTEIAKDMADTLNPRALSPSNYTLFGQWDNL